MTATPASHPFEIREHDDGPVHVIAMRGELDLATAPRLCVRIDAARRAGFRRILIDLTTAEFCDSAGLSVFFGASRRAAAHGGTVTLRGVRGRLRRILVVTGVTTMFRLWDEDSLGAGSQS